MNFRTQMFPFIKEYVSVHHPIIYTGLRDLTPMLLSIDMKLHFFFNAWMEFREQNQTGENVVNSLMLWLQLRNIRKSQLIMPYISKYYLMEQCNILQFGWRASEHSQNRQFSIPKFHHSLHPRTIPGTCLSPDLRSLDQSDLISKAKHVPVIVFFVRTTTETYYEKGGAWVHVQWTHAHLLCWKTFLRPLFWGKKEGELGRQRVYPPMLRRNRKVHRCPS